MKSAFEGEELLGRGGLVGDLGNKLKKFCLTCYYLLKTGNCKQLLSF